MICFTLRCDRDHSFDSWFTSSLAFDALAQAGHLVCPTCGDAHISKGLMAPAISSKTSDDAPAPLTQPQTDVEQAMAQMRQIIEANSDYVGMNFAAEARKIHLGEAPTRAIYGEAKMDEARALLEDGIPVAPLPFMPRAKVN
jgi:hypothetical protein